MNRTDLGMLAIALTGCAWLAGCRAPAAPAVASADGTDLASGFLRGGRAGLEEARRSGRGAMLLFAASW